MTKKDRIKIIKSISFPNEFDHKIQRDIAYQIVGVEFFLLKGFLVDSSGSDKNKFYLYSFIQPMYQLSDSIILTYGNIIKNPATDSGQWDINEYNQNEINQAIHNEYVNFLSEINNSYDFYNYLSNKITDNSNSKKLITAIFTAITIKETKNINNLILRVFELCMENRFEWQKNHYKIAESISSEMENNDFSCTISILKENQEKMSIWLQTMK